MIGADGLTPETRALDAAYIFASYVEAGTRVRLHDLASSGEIFGAEDLGPLLPGERLHHRLALLEAFGKKGVLECVLVRTDGRFRVRWRGALQAGQAARGGGHDAA